MHASATSHIIKDDLNQYKIPFGQPLREVFSETTSHIATYDVPADSAWCVDGHGLIMLSIKSLYR